MSARLVAGYFRVSQARDGMQAPDIYREQIEGYCSYKDLDLARIYAVIARADRAEVDPDLERFSVASALPLQRSVAKPVTGLTGLTGLTS